VQVREAAQPDSQRPCTHPPHWPFITTEQPATEQPATQQPATEQPVTQQPATEQPAANPSLFEDPQVTEAAMAEATGGSVPAGAQRGKRARQQPARFGCADMKLSAAQVFGREDENEAPTDHGPPPPAPPFARPPQSPPPPPPSFATAALAADTINPLALQAARRHPDHRFSRSGKSAKGLHLSRQRLAH